MFNSLFLNSSKMISSSKWTLTRQKSRIKLCASSNPTLYLASISYFVKLVRLLSISIANDFRTDQAIVQEFRHVRLVEGQLVVDRAHARQADSSFGIGGQRGHHISEGLDRSPRILDALRHLGHTLRLEQIAQLIV
jgi:hypothetical protein